ncbi:MAG: beta-ketoacyl-ACP synthase II [Fimbriimonadaceae bacterium]|nr:beta-ketoacyl-ACP synthase II [Fimbriimonadaceae bacterium]
MSSWPEPSGRVVITGLGAITPIGTGAETVWRNALAGKSGVARIELIDPAPFTTQIAAEVKDFQATDWLDRKEARRVDRVIAMGVGAARLALADASVTLTDELRNQFGVYIGSGIGGLSVMYEQTTKMIAQGPDRVSPFWVPYMIANMPGGFASIELDLRGPNVAPVTACSTGANAIGDAYHVIKRGDATMMLAGGVEAPITEIGVAAFCAARAMSTRNDEPERASRPFDVGRDGFVMGEGSTVLVLEDYAHAIARGARIYAEVVGYGLTADAYHITAPHPEGSGAIRSMQMALRNAGIAPEQIDYINAHGTSTPLGDVAETLAIKRTFGEHAYRLAVSSTKSMTGHTLGAAGALESLFCTLALRDQVLPPTINLEQPDPECDLDYVPNAARPTEIEYALNNSFGFGGHNVSLVLKRHASAERTGASIGV